MDPSCVAQSQQSGNARARKPHSKSINGCATTPQLVSPFSSSTHRHHHRQTNRSSSNVPALVFTVTEYHLDFSPASEFIRNRGTTVAMAISTMKRSSSSSNSSIRSYASSSTANVRASCYVVNVATASLQGYHYSTTGAAGAEWCS